MTERVCSKCGSKYKKPTEQEGIIWLVIIGVGAFVLASIARQLLVTYGFSSKQTAVYVFIGWIGVFYTSVQGLRDYLKTEKNVYIRCPSCDSADTVDPDSPLGREWQEKAERREKSKE